MAKELVELYAWRQALGGHAYGPDTPWQQEMESAFPYNETPDQLDAIYDVKKRPGKAARRWTGSSAATSATARPRSPSARRSRS